MDNAVLATFNKLVGVEIDLIDEQLAKEISRRIGEASMRGMLHSSRANISVAEEVKQTLPLRSQTALNTLLRSMTANGIAVSPANEEEVVATLAEWIAAQTARCVAIFNERAPYKQGIDLEIYIKPILRAGDQETRRMTGEIELIAAASRQVDANSSDKHGSNFVINAPVGVIQSGPGSFAVAHQHIDAGARDALERALEHLSKELRETDEPVHFNRSEIEAVILEATEEIRKKQPNGAKLKALVAGVANAISFVPKLRPAYDTLKWAAGMIGVTLP